MRNTNTNQNSCLCMFFSWVVLLLSQNILVIKTTARKRDRHRDCGIEKFLGIIGYCRRFQNLLRVIVSRSQIKWVSLDDNIYWANGKPCQSLKSIFSIRDIYSKNGDVHNFVIVNNLSAVLSFLISLFSPKFYLWYVLCFFIPIKLFVDFILEYIMLC